MPYDAILVTAGRSPNVGGLSLETAGVQYEASKGVLVNDKLQTSNHDIFACGDVAQSEKFTHAADFGARTVIGNALFFGKKKVSSLVVPRATYTMPEIASVGMTQAQLVGSGMDYRSIDIPFADVDRAICQHETEGFVRLYMSKKQKDQIIGAVVVGKDAGEMICEITLAMFSKTGLYTLAYCIHPYPTRTEAIRKAGDVARRELLSPFVEKLLGKVCKVRR